MRHVARAAVTTVALSTICLAAAPANAARVVVPGGAFPDALTGLSYVSCGGFFGEAVAPTLRINRGPAQNLGQFSYGMVMRGPGTAAGVLQRTESMSSLGSVSFSVIGEGANSGVAYVWYAAPDLPAGQAYLGSAKLTAASDRWNNVSLDNVKFSWRAYDVLDSRAVSEATSAKISTFVKSHGNGSGYVVAGFGCNGSSFNFDGFKADGHEYDLEGLTLRADATVAPIAGKTDAVTVNGTVLLPDSTNAGNPMVLQKRDAAGAWSDVTGEQLLPDGAGKVATEASTAGVQAFRWRVPASEYSVETFSKPVAVTPTAVTPTPSETATQAPIPSESASTTPTQIPTPPPADPTTAPPAPVPPASSAPATEPAPAPSAPPAPATTAPVTETTAPAGASTATGTVLPTPGDVATTAAP